MDYQTNPQLQLAFDFVQYTNTNIFLTGKAGTGKTTFLKNLRLQSPKRMIVVGQLPPENGLDGILGSLLKKGAAVVLAEQRRHQRAFA